MRLVSFRDIDGKSQIGILLDEMVVDLTNWYRRYLIEQNGVSSEVATNLAHERMPTSMLGLIKKGKNVVMASIKETVEFAEDSLKQESPIYSKEGKKMVYNIEDVKILPPVPKGNRNFNIGANYPAYVDGMPCEAPPTDKPAMFIVPEEAVIGQEDCIEWPVSAERVSTEIELGIVIGEEAKRIPKSEASDVIFGYTVVNDITGIDIVYDNMVLPGMFWSTRAKGLDTFQSVGPCISLGDEILDPQSLYGELKINGELRAKGNTKDMRAGINRLIEYISEDITLYPGDVIATGGMGNEDMEPHGAVKPGDTVEARIEKIGTLKNYVRGPYE